MILNKGDKIEIDPLGGIGYFQGYVALGQGATTNIAGMMVNLGERLYVIYANKRGELRYTDIESVKIVKKEED